MASIFDALNFESRDAKDQLPLPISCINVQSTLCIQTFRYF